MPEYLTIQEAARRLGRGKRYVCQLCDKGKLAGASKENGRWRIPRTAHPKLAQVEDINIDLTDVPIKKREKATRREGLIDQFKKFSATAEKRISAMQAFCLQNNIKVRSFERWLARYRIQGLAGLIDCRGVKIGSEIISDEAFEYFKSLYLKPQQLSVKTCWQNINYTNTSESRGWKIPSLAAMYKYIDKKIPMAVTVLHREGLAAYEAKCAPYIVIDLNTIEPGAVWVGDHHQFNCWVRFRNRWVRPWLTAWEDVRSRMLVGWHISALPNQTTIMLAAKRGIEKYGPPESVKIDNGKDFDSEMFTGTTKVRRRLLKKGYLDEPMLAGIYVMLGIGISFSIKYHPQSKSIERWFDTLDCQFTKTIATYCGKDTQRRPEELAEQLKNEKTIREAYSLEEFAEIAGQYIAVYNKTAHSGRGMEGRTPAAVFATRQSRRVLTDGVLDLLMRVWSGELTVGKNGVQFKGLWYGQYDANLMLYQSKKVRAAYDPDDIQKLYIYDAATMRLITIAEQAQLVGSGTDEGTLRAAMAQKAAAKKIVKQYRNAQLTADTDIAALTINARRAAIEQPPAENIRSLKIVRTPLDEQVAEHKRLETIKAVRKASGAESLTTVLDIDFSLLKPKRFSGPKIWDE